MTLSRERCRGTLQSHNNSEEGSKKLAKTEPKHMCLHFSCCREEVKDETVLMAGGRLFHARDAATGKARLPRVCVYLKDFTICSSSSSVGGSGTNTSLASSSSFSSFAKHIMI